MTSASTIGRPASIGKPARGSASRTYCARNAPAKPAIPADSMNTTTLVSSTFTPTVADAASLSRSAIEPPAERAAPERDDADAARSRTPTVTRSRNDFGCRRSAMPKQVQPARRAPALDPSANGWVKNTLFDHRRERERREREIQALEAQGGEREERADRDVDERREEHRADAAVRAAEARVRDRADARERERRERDLAGPAGERHERERDERGAHAEREAVEVGRVAARQAG